MLAGQAIMINWSDVAVENRQPYYEWHSREHMVGRVAITGFQRGRRFIRARASRDFLMLYEVDDLSVLTGAEYMAKANNPSALTRSTTPLISNSVRALALVQLSLGIGVGGHMLTLRFDPADASAARLRAYLIDEALPRMSAMPEIVGVHFCVADQTSSRLVPVERRGRPTVVPNWIVLIEGVSSEALEHACDAQLAQEMLSRHGCASTAERDTYSLQLAVSKPRAPRV